MNATDTAPIEHYPPTSPEFQSAASPTRHNRIGLQNDEDSRPLLGHAPQSNGSDEIITEENQYVTELYKTDDRMTRFAILLVGCAAISGLLFGTRQLITCCSRLTLQDMTLVVIGSDLGHPLQDIEKVRLILHPLC
jgi:hypothetical protein